jgi:serine phosphatase RsbU (regulator of sigma subunit)
MGKYQANTSSNSKDFFECIYYFDLNEKAKTLSKEYNLKEKINTTDYKLNGVCYSIQNYFISLFEKASPKIMKILNFKKILIEKNISFTNFEHSILTDEKFQLKITSTNLQKLQIIEAEARAYFNTLNTTIQIKENSVLIYPKKTFKIIYDSATLSHNNCQISGDNFMFKNINDANFVCALSDGMGSGYYAYQLSQQTLKMVDQITDCSIEFETSLEILNNFFKTKDSVDSYATLDFVDINLSTGVLNLYKMGSTTTYVLHNNSLTAYQNKALPLKLDEMNSTFTFDISSGDLIFLLSDGITDFIDQNEFYSLIDVSESPENICSKIIEHLKIKEKNNLKDDLSLIVIKSI